MHSVSLRLINSLDMKSERGLQRSLTETREIMSFQCNRNQWIGLGTDKLNLAYPMIAALFIGCTIFARNSLKGQPALQQRLVKLPVYIGLASDVSTVANHSSIYLSVPERISRLDYD